MRAYKVTEKSPYTRYFRIVGWGAVLFLLGILLFSSYEPVEVSDRATHALGWLAFAVVLGAIAGALFLVQKEAVWKVNRGLQVEVADGKIIQESKEGPTVEIPLSGIVSVQEWRGWLIVRGGNPAGQIVVPRSVGGFEELRRELETHCKITEVKMKLSPWTVLLYVFVIAAFILLFTSHYKAIVLAAAVVILALQGAAMYQIRRVWRGSARRWLFLFTYILLILCAFLVIYERFGVVK